MLVTGLALFVGAHLLPGIPGLRALARAKLGDGPWKGLVSLGALVGLGLILWGWGSASTDLVRIPAAWTRHLAWTAIPLAFVLMSAAYVPSRIGWFVGHPMSASVALWGGVHVLANHEWRSMVLFGTFCAWGLAAWLLAGLRDGFRPKPYPEAPRDAQVVIVGLALGAVVMRTHGWLFGVPVVP